MAKLRLFVASLAICGSIVPVSGTRAYDRRSDLVSPPSVSGLDWAPPLSNGYGESLPPIPQDQHLTYLALSRGHRSYRCQRDSENVSSAVLVEDTATLINVEPLLLFIHDENELHRLPAEIIQFDYSQLNTTYDCYGSYNGTSFTGVIELDGREEINVSVTGSMESPRPRQDMSWYTGESVDSRQKSDGEWTFYVVETNNGSGRDCIESHYEILVEYAAEFWLYRRGR